MAATNTDTPLSDALQLQREQNGLDCLPCRLTGSAAFTGLGVYSLHTGMKQIRERELEILKSSSKFGIGLRRANVFLFSGVLVGLGVYRLYN